MKITINNQDLDFNFKYLQVCELLEKTGKKLENLQEIAEDIKNASLIGSIGFKKEEAEVKEMLQEGSFENIRLIIEAFSMEVLAFISPNSVSQTN